MNLVFLCLWKVVLVVGLSTYSCDDPLSFTLLDQGSFDTLVNKMEDMKEVIELGERLGYEGSDLRQFVDRELKRCEERKESERQREERALQRDITRQKEKEAHEIEVLRLKATLPAREAGDPKPLSLKMPPFEEDRDKLDAYLERFERFATSQKWQKHDWAVRLGALLKGRSLEVYSRLPSDEALDYEKLKLALLKHYQMTEDGYRTKFRTTRPQKNETPCQFAARISGYLHNWVKMSKIDHTYEGLIDLLLREQFLISCSKDLGLFLRERECTSIDSMTETAERYVEAHGQYSFTAFQKSNYQGSANVKPFGKAEKYSGKVSEQKSKEELKPSHKVSASNNQSYRCYNCGRQGHRSFECRDKKKSLAQAIEPLNLTEQTEQAISEAVERAVKLALKTKTSPDTEAGACLPVNSCQAESIANGSRTDNVETALTLNMSCQATVGKPESHPPGMPSCKGYIAGVEVSVLRDTGCSSAVVRSELVKSDEYTGNYQTCTLIDGTIRTFPLADIYVDTPFFRGMDNPVYDLIIGNLVGAREPKNPDSNWIPESNKQISNESQENLVTAVETRFMKVRKRKTPSSLAVPSAISEVNQVDFINAQKNDPSLTHLWDKTAQKQEGKYQFLVKNQMLVRKQQDKLNIHKFHTRFVVPKQYRAEIVRLGHESLMSGHQGMARTYERVASQFFWPGIYNEVSKYCKSCDICQKTVPKGKVTKVPLGKVPLISEPFKRIAMDIVGPIFPASNRGKRFILTVMDYATRYPEAIALSNIETETVAEALLAIYGRLGIPSEVLTDMGSQFTSAIMCEVSRLLSIKQLTTSPYNPKCNGMIEKFNGTLKQMLKRMCNEQPKDWDRYLIPLLFAYREAPHESLGGFSPFELLYGRSVRGPMQVLKELLTKVNTEDEVKTTYQYVIDLKERLKDTCTIAQEMLGKQAAKYKRYYDQKSKPRNLKAGDQVLVLLPTDKNKLLLQWKGPYQVLHRFNDCDYKIQIKDKEKTFHINLLKKYISRETNLEESLCFFELPSKVTEQDTDSKLEKQNSIVESLTDCYGEINDGKTIVPLPSVTRKQGPDNVVINESLSDQQKSELRKLVQEYESIFTDVPKQTNVIECEIQLTTNDPIRSRPYPVPQALKQTLKDEIRDMLSLGVIERSNSSYASPVVMVRKKDGSVRFCIHFRKLNRIIVFDPEPMPNPEHLFAELHDSMFFTKIDMTKGYWQIPMSESSKEKTAFVTSEGQFQFRFMPFGLVVAGAIFSRMMRKLFSHLPQVACYIDDILVHTRSWSEHMSVLQVVFDILFRANLAIKPSKCCLGYGSLEFLGHHVGNGQLATNPDLIAKIQSKERPTTKKEVRSFLELTGYYRKFIANYAEIAVPLSDLTKKGQSNKVKWGDAQERSFQTLKSLLVKPPILQLPVPTKQFILRCDASDKGIAGILLQESEGVLHPVAYASRKLLEREQNYSVIEKECLSIIWAINKFDLYLFGVPFIIQTDHKPLVYIHKSKCLNKRIMRWAILLQEYRFKVESVPGKTNCGPDFLSRVPIL